MTIIELFPWLLAICVATLIGMVLTRTGLSGVWVWVVAATAGIVSFVLYQLVLRQLVSTSEQQRTRREKQEKENRKHQQLDAAKSYPTGENLFYECLVCGNEVPSMPRKDISCKCRNILIHANARHIEIREHARAKLFSLGVL